MIDRTVSIAAMAICLWVSAIGANPARADDAPFARTVTSQIVVLPGNLLDETSTEEITIKSTSALSKFGQIIFPVNEHFWDAEILEAYTIKADGRHIDVPPDRILVSATANTSTLGIFEADTKIRTVVFPNVAVGDTIHYKLHLKEKKHALGDDFTLLHVVPPWERYARFTVTLDAPQSLKLNYGDTDFTKTVERQGDREHTTWTLKPAQYRPREALETESIDHNPYLMVSSYADWESVGRAFFNGADPQSRPTPEIKSLADQITIGIDDKRAQAQAIRDWTAKNIRYFAIFLGQGGFVPHPASEVLQNRYGDCKDHVTLMRALLAAKEIKADYALISLAPTYQTPTTASASWFNHVILWLPELGLYADPTAQFASFSSLPISDADKPVLQMSKETSLLARTPALSASTNRLSIKSDLTIAPDGTLSGSSETTATGPIAHELRVLASEVSLKGGNVIAEDLMREKNWHGVGTIEPRDPYDYSEPYSLKASFSIAGNFTKGHHLLPVIPKMVVPAYAAFEQIQRDSATQDFQCNAESFEQNVDVHLPPGMSIDNVPHRVTVSAGNALFNASARVDGNKLNIVRRFVVKPAGQSCHASEAVEMSGALEALRKALKWQPHFKVAGQLQ